jgi:hypothetical protein
VFVAISSISSDTALLFAVKDALNASSLIPIESQSSSVNSPFFNFYNTDESSR